MAAPHVAGVAALRNIKNPSLVAQKVLERSDHVLTQDIERETVYAWLW